jgi:hypothetical protein
MRVVVTIRMAFEAENYGRAGAILDSSMERVHMEMKDAKGHADLVGFETRPCKAAQFNQVEYGGEPTYNAVQSDRSY